MENLLPKPVSRKHFLSSLPFIALLPGMIPDSLVETPKRLSFSTLGCPDWPFYKIIDFARTNKYSGIEVRGILRQTDLTKVPEFANPDAIAKTLQKMADHGLMFVDLGSSAAMHLPPGEEREKNLKEAKQFIDLARHLKCPFIRVFPNQLPKERDRQESLRLIIEGLKELGEYASTRNVSILLESHGELIYKNDLLTVMQGVANPHVALVWDICNMWVVTKEPPEEVYALLKPYIRHTHIKDMQLVNGKEEYVLLGTGMVPIFKAIDILFKDNYAGYYSFEWEKLWHPEIPEPEIALADYSMAMNRHFSNMKG